MRRWLIALAVALGAGALWAGAAFADNTSYHGGYTATTYRCASCHRAHTAKGESLIKSETVFGLCTSCHGRDNGTDVLDGVKWTYQPPPAPPAPDPRIPDKTVAPRGALRGGGFENTIMNTNLTDVASVPVVLKPSTSAHRVRGMTNADGTAYTGDTVWGIGGLNSGAGASFALDCTTCHDPHGKSGVAGAPTYRILRSNVAAKLPGASGVVTVSEQVAPEVKVNTVSDANYKYYGQTYTDARLMELSAWCASCHTRIHASGTGVGGESSGDSIYNFRHRTDGANVGTSDALGAPACMTCHVSHGSSAVAAGGAAEVPEPGTAEKGGVYQGSALLRIDNRGVCQACHNK